jgi:hypothetical protein
MIFNVRSRYRSFDHGNHERTIGCPIGFCEIAWQKIWCSGKPGTAGYQSQKDTHRRTDNPNILGTLLAQETFQRKHNFLCPFICFLGINISVCKRRHSLPQRPWWEPCKLRTCKTFLEIMLILWYHLWRMSNMVGGCWCVWLRSCIAKCLWCVC